MVDIDVWKRECICDHTAYRLNLITAAREFINRDTSTHRSHYLLFYFFLCAVLLIIPAKFHQCVYIQMKVHANVILLVLCGIFVFVLLLVLPFEWDWCANLVFKTSNTLRPKEFRSRPQISLLAEDWILTRSNINLSILSSQWLSVRTSHTMKEAGGMHGVCVCVCEPHTCCDDNSSSSSRISSPIAWWYQRCQSSIVDGIHSVPQPYSHMMMYIINIMQTNGTHWQRGCFSHIYIRHHHTCGCCRFLHRGSNLIIATTYPYLLWLDAKVTMCVELCSAILCMAQ